MWTSPEFNLRYDWSHSEKPKSDDNLHDIETEHALWERFSGAATLEDFLQSWMAIQCRIISGVSGGLILVGSPDTGPFTPPAIWPNRRHNVTHLSETAEKALTERRGMFFKRDPGEGKDAAGQERYEVAMPFEVSGRMHGVVVLDISPRSGSELQHVLRQLHWGSAWVDAMYLRMETQKESLARNKLQKVFDLATAAAGYGTFDAAATSFVTALASKLDCDRVSIGFKKAGHVHVQAFSHSA